MMFEIWKPANGRRRGRPATAAVASALTLVLVALGTTLGATSTSAAPEDAVNAAPRATVSSSVHGKGAIGSNFNANAILDGVKYNSGGAGSPQTWCTWYNGTAGGPEWLQLSWPDQIEGVAAVDLWFWGDGSGTVMPTAWNLQYSLDGETWSDIALEDGAAYPVNSSGASSVEFAAPVTVKHLRANIDQIAGKYIAVSEFEVFSQAPQPVNTAKESYATSSVDDKGAIGDNFDVNGIFDGLKKNSGSGSADTWCTWYNGTAGGSEWLQLNWFIPMQLSAADLWFWGDGSGTIMPSAWTLQYSLDGETWTEAELADGSSYTVNSSGASSVEFASPVTARFLRAQIEQVSGKYIAVSEFEAFSPAEFEFVSRAELVDLWRAAQRKDAANYTPQTWAAFAAALAAAEAELSNEAATSDSLQTVSSALSDAMNGLMSVQVLAVDFGDGASYGELYGGANGTLYGFGADGAPTDSLVSGAAVENTSQKPAEGQQHPSGDVMEIEDQFVESGEGNDLYIYMQDFYPDWAYNGGSRPGDTRTYVTDPLNSNFGTYTQAGNGTWDYLEVAELVTRFVLENSDKLDHYVLVPFNEADEGNWAGAYGYHETLKSQFLTDWDAVYRKIHGLYDEYAAAGKIDPNAEPRIGGPGDAAWRPTRTKAFLTHALANNTLPDVVIWHELSEENVNSYKSHYASYRQIETTLGIDPLPVNISEWGELRDMSVAGQIIQWFAIFEDTKVQAQTAYWNYAGNISDNQSRANNANAAWWIFKWYGDLRVTDTESAINTYKAVAYKDSAAQSAGTANTDMDKLAAIAALDTANRKATIIYGGATTKSSSTIEDTGQNISVKVDMRNLDPEVFGDEVDVEVRETQFVAADGFAQSPRLVNSQRNIDISDGTLEVTTPSADRYAGYQLVVTPARDIDPDENPDTSRLLLEEEAEDLSLASDSALNASVEQRSPTGSGWGHLMFSGNSHVASFGQGATATWQVSDLEAADYRLQIISANDGFPGAIKVCVDGGNCKTVEYEAEEAVHSMSNMNYRGGIQTVLSLPAGDHSITIVNDGRAVELDKVQLYQISSDSDGAGLDARKYTATSDFRLKDGAQLSYDEGTRGWIDLNGGSAALHATAWESGYQNLRITYSAPAGTSFDVLVHGIETATITAADGLTGSATVVVPLSEGVNEIDLTGDPGVLIESVVASRNAAKDETAISFEAEDLTLAGSARIITDEQLSAPNYAENGGPQTSTASNGAYVTGLGTQFETYVYHTSASGAGGDKTRLLKNSTTNEPVVKTNAPKGQLVIEQGQVPPGTYNIVFRYSNDNINPNNNPDIAAAMDLGLQLRQDNTEIARAGFRWTYTDSSFMSRSVTATIDGSSDIVLGNWDEPGDLKAAVSWGGAPNIDSITFYPMTVRAPAPLDLGVTVTTRCTAGNAFVLVQVGNNDEVPAEVVVNTDFGAKTFPAVAPTKKALQSFTTRLKQLPAGTLTVAGSALNGRSFAQAFSYPALACGS
ncbi:MAG: discoidin domain-containing protein [Bifidobacteriaceae bacterium]|jgi:hypothetical protein|nr:discoidin domain-containing protein [Bifidobacteriaceae bacterium]